MVKEEQDMATPKDKLMKQITQLQSKRSHAQGQVTRALDVVNNSEKLIDTRLASLRDAEQRYQVMQEWHEKLEEVVEANEIEELTVDTKAIAASSKAKVDEFYAKIVTTREAVYKHREENRPAAAEPVAQPHGEDNGTAPKTIDVSAEAASTITEVVRASLSVPKFEVTKFNGDPSEYQLFMCFVDYEIISVSKDPRRRLSMLIGATTGKAWEAIRNCMAVEVPE